MKLRIKNPKVVIFSLLAVGFVVLSFAVHWLFIIGAVILVGLNQKEILGKKK
ncbi:MAG: hypothetical protein PHH00_00130 [Candidatus Nanoarchaeia archaeon]|nr:hypothetical protein [Candidatus Nanoarchaeia archaeon]